MTYPVGLMMLWHAATIPDGWLEANGQSTAGYPQLATLYGGNLPNMTDGKAVFTSNNALQQQAAQASVGGTASYDLNISVSDASSDARVSCRLREGNGHGHGIEFNLSDANFNFQQCQYHGRDPNGGWGHLAGGGWGGFQGGRNVIRHYHSWSCDDPDPNSKRSQSYTHSHRIDASINRTHDHTYNMSATLNITGNGSTTRPNTVTTRFIIKHD